MNFRALLLFAILCASCSKSNINNSSKYTTEDKVAIVYTTTSNTSDANNWVQIVATYDGNICTIYKNV